MGSSGFTLLEMLFSIFLIAIIISFVSSNLINEVSRSDVTSAGYEIQAGLELARSCALATAEDATVSFGQSAVTIKCERVDRNLKFDDVVITTNFPNNIAKFDEHGNVSQAATIEICNQRLCQTLTIGVGRSDVNVK